MKLDRVHLIDDLEDLIWIFRELEEKIDELKEEVECLQDDIEEKEDLIQELQARLAGLEK